MDNLGGDSNASLMVIQVFIGVYVQTTDYGIQVVKDAYQNTMAIVHDAMVS